MSYTDILDQIYANSGYEANRNLTYAKQLTASLGGGSNLPSFLDRFYAREPGAYAEMVMPAPKPVTTYPGSQDPMTDSEAVAAMNRTMAALQEMLAQPGLSDEDRERLQAYGNELANNQRQILHPEVSLPWWKRVLLKLEPFSRPMQTVLELAWNLGAGASNIIVNLLGEERASRLGFDYMPLVSLDEMLHTAQGQYEQLRGGPDSMFGEEGMFTSTDFFRNAGVPELEFTDNAALNIPIALGKAVRGLSAFAGDVAADPFSYVGLGASLVGSTSRAIGVGSVVDSALREAVIESAGRRGWIGVVDAAEKMTVGRATMEFMRFPWVRRVLRQVDDQIDTVRALDNAELMDILDGIQASVPLGRKGAAAGGYTAGQTKALYARMEKAITEFNAAHGPQNIVDRAVGTVKSDLFEHTVRPIVSRRFFEVDQDFLQLVDLPVAEGGLPKWAAGGIRIGTITGNGGWVLPHTTGVGSWLKAHTLGRVWSTAKDNLPILARAAEKLDDLASKFGRDHFIISLARKGNIMMWSAEQDAKSAIGILVRRAVDSVERYGAVMNHVVSEEGLDYNVVMREITDFMQARDKSAWTSGSKLIGGNDRVHKLAIEYAGKMEDSMQRLWQKARDYNSTLGKLDDYLPSRETEWGKQVTEALADSGIDIDPTRGAGFQILSDIVASVRQKMAVSKLGHAPSMEKRTIGRVVVEMLPLDDLSSNPGQYLIPAILKDHKFAESFFAPTTELNKVVGEALQTVLGENPKVLVPRRAAVDSIPGPNGLAVPKVFEDNASALVQGYISQVGHAVEEWAIVDQFKRINYVMARKMSQGKAVRIQDAVNAIIGSWWDTSPLRKELAEFVATGGKSRYGVRKMVKRPLGTTELELWDQIWNQQPVQEAYDRVTKEYASYVKGTHPATGIPVGQVVQEIMDQTGLPREVAETIAAFPSDAMSDFCEAILQAGARLSDEFAVMTDRAVGLLGPEFRAVWETTGKPARRTATKAASINSLARRTVNQALSDAQEQMFKIIRQAESEGKVGVEKLQTTRRTVERVQPRQPSPLLEASEHLDPALNSQRLTQQQMQQMVGQYIMPKITQRFNQMRKEVADEISQIERLQQQGRVTTRSETTRTRIREIDESLAALDEGQQHLLEDLRYERRGIQPHAAEVIGGQPEGTRRAWSKGQVRDKLVGQPGQQPAGKPYEVGGWGPTTLPSNEAEIARLDQEIRRLSAAVDTERSKLLAERDNLEIVAQEEDIHAQRLSYLHAKQDMLDLAEARADMKMAMVVYLDFARRIRVSQNFEAARDLMVMVEDGGGYKAWSGKWRGVDYKLTAAQVAVKANDLFRDLMQRADLLAIGDHEFFDFPPLIEAATKAVRIGKATLASLEDMRAWGWLDDMAGPELDDTLFRQMDTFIDSGLTEEGHIPTGRLSEQPGALPGEEFATMRERLRRGAENLEEARPAEGAQGRPRDVVSKAGARLEKAGRRKEAQRIMTARFKGRPWDDPDVLRVARAYGLDPHIKADKMLIQEWMAKAMFRNLDDDPLLPKTYTLLDKQGQPIMHTVKGGGKVEVPTTRPNRLSLMATAWGVKYDTMLGWYNMVRSGAGSGLQGDALVTDLTRPIARTGGGVTEKLLPSDAEMVKIATVGHHRRVAGDTIMQMRDLLFDVSAELRTTMDIGQLDQGVQKVGGNLGNKIGWEFATPRIKIVDGGFRIPDATLEKLWDESAWPTTAEAHFALASSYMEGMAGKIIQPVRNADGTWGWAVMPSYGWNKALARRGKEYLQTLVDEGRALNRTPQSLGNHPWSHATADKIVPDWSKPPAARVTHNMNSYMGVHLAETRKGADLWVRGWADEGLGVLDFEVVAKRFKAYRGDRRTAGRLLPGKPLDAYRPPKEQVEAIAQQELQGISAHRPFRFGRADAELQDDAISHNMRANSARWQRAAQGVADPEGANLFGAAIRRCMEIAHGGGDERAIAEALGRRVDGVYREAFTEMRPFFDNIEEITATLQANPDLGIIDILIDTFKVPEERAYAIVGSLDHMMEQDARQAVAESFRDNLIAEGYDSIVYWNDIISARPTIDELLDADPEARAIQRELEDIYDKMVGLDPTGGDRVVAAGLESEWNALVKLQGVLDKRMEAKMRSFTWGEMKERALGEFSVIVLMPEHQLIPSFDKVMVKEATLDWLPVTLADKQLRRFVNGLATALRGGADRLPEVGTRRVPRTIEEVLLQDPIVRGKIQTIIDLDDSMSKHVAPLEAVAEVVEGATDKQLAAAGITGRPLKLVRTAQGVKADKMREVWGRLRLAVDQTVADPESRGLWDALYQNGKETADLKAAKRWLPERDWRRLIQQAEFHRVAGEMRALIDAHGGDYIPMDEIRRAFISQQNASASLSLTDAVTGLGKAIKDAEVLLETNQSEAVIAADQLLQSMHGLLKEWAVESDSTGALELNKATFNDVTKAFGTQLNAVRADAKKLLDAHGITEAQYRQIMERLKLKGHVGTVQNVPGFMDPGLHALGTGPLQGMVVRPEVLQFFDNYAKVTQNMWKMQGMRELAKGYQKFYQWWKTWVTVGNFTRFIPRNIMGGTWNGMFIGVRAYDYARSANLLRTWWGITTDIKGDPHALEAALAKLPARDSLALQMAYKEGVFDTFASTEFARAMSNLPSLKTWRGFARALNPFNRKEHAAIRVGTKLMRTSEDWMRFAAFLRYFEAGTPFSERRAASMAKVAHFDYSDLTNAEVWMKDHLVPFFVWGKRNLEFQIRAVMERPELIYRYWKLQYNMQQEFGGGDYYNAYPLAPYWGRYAVGTGIVMNEGTPFWARIFFDPDMPINDLFDFEQVYDQGLSMDGLYAWLGNMLGPQVELPFDFISKSDDPYKQATSVGLLQMVAMMDRIPGINFVKNENTGDYRVDSRLASAFSVAFPFVNPLLGNWMEPLAPTNPATAQRLGYTPDGRDWGDRLTAFMLRQAAPLGIKVQTPADVPSALYPINATIERIMDDMQWADRWADVDANPAGQAPASGPGFDAYLDRLFNK